MKKKKDFFQELRDRNVWREIKAYLFGGATIIPLIWMIQKFIHFEDEVIMIIFIIFFSLFPSVFLFAYHHGESREAPWSKAEKRWIPTNLVVTLLLIIFFYNNTLTAVETTTKLVKNLATGEFVERDVVKPEFRKKLMISYFKNESGDTSLNWLEQGLTYGCKFDLEQDIYISASKINDWRLESLGFKYADDIPIATYLKEARRSEIENVLTGSFTKTDNIFKVKFSIWDANKGRKISEDKELISESIFDIIDKVTMSVKSILLQNKDYVAEAVDFTVSSQLTESFMAYKYFILSKEYIKDPRNKNKNLAQEQINLLNKAINIDPHFAWAYYENITHYDLLNQTDSVELFWKEIIKKLSLLTTDRQYEVKANWYLHQEMDDKAISIYQKWGLFAPDNLDPFLSLGWIYFTKGDYKKALVQYKQVLSIDFNYKEIDHYIVNCYKKLGKFNKAIEHHKKLITNFPEEAGLIYSLGRMFDDLREIDSARYYFERTIEKDLFSNHALWSRSYLNSYEIDQTMDPIKRKNIIYSAYKFAENKRDSLSIEKKIARNIYHWQGKINRYWEIYDSLYNLQDRSPVTTYRWSNEVKSVRDLRKNLWKYESLGNDIEVLKIVQEITEEFYISNPDKIPEDRKKAEDYPPYSKSVRDGIAREYYDAMYNLYVDEFYYKGKFEEEMEYFLEYTKIRKNNQEYFSHDDIKPYRIQAQTFSLNNQYDSAIILLEKHKTDISFTSYIYQLAICYQKNKEYAKAEENFKLILKEYPFSPKTNHNIALLYYDWGKKEKAIEHLNISLEIWKNADADYVLSNRAKATAQEWKTEILN